MTRATPHGARAHPRRSPGRAGSLLGHPVRPADRAPVRRRVPPARPPAPNAGHNGNGGRARARQPPNRLRNDEEDVLLPLAEAAVEVREPVRPVRHVHPHVVARRHQLVPAARAQAVEHLELEPRGRDRLSPGCRRARAGPATRRGWRWPGSFPCRAGGRRAAPIARPDVVHVLEGDLRRLLVRALADPDPVAAARSPPSRPAPCGAGRPGGRCRRCRTTGAAAGRCRSCAACASSPPCRCARSRPTCARRVQHAGGQLQAEVLGDVEAHGGELDRDVALHLGGDAAQQVLVGLRELRTAASRSRTSSPSRSKVELMPRACSSRPAAMAESAVSPATKRRARMLGGLTGRASPRTPRAPRWRCRRARGSRPPPPCAADAAPRPGRRGSRW